ncbi:MAG: tetratricopeptide repeat protein [Spirochaetota bacterium]
MSTTTPVAKAAGWILMTSLLASCNLRQDDHLEDVLALEPPSVQEEGPTPERIEELEAAIERFREIVDAKVEASRNMAVYYKMLASEYIERQMFGLALDALDEAIVIQPENPSLYYTAGVSAARFGKSQIETEAALELFNRAEAYYRRCIELDPRHADAYYGLAVLYEFEVGRSADAQDTLEELISFDPNNYAALGLLARIYVGEGRVSDALDIYEDIIANAGDPELRSQAVENRRRLLGEVP